MVSVRTSPILAGAFLFQALLSLASLVDANAGIPHPSGNPTSDIDNYTPDVLFKRSPMAGMSAISGMAKRGEDDTFRAVLRRNVEEMLNTNHNKQTIDNLPVLARRQDTNSSGSVNVDPIDWNADVMARCNQTLQGTTASGNPAGIVVCYNLPYLDRTTGVFSSDLRMYKVTAADADWAALGRNVSISLQYQGAMVQVSNPSPSSKRSLDKRQATSVSSGMATTTSTSTSTSMPYLVRSFRFVGQINPDVQSKLETMDSTNPNTTDMYKSLLTPSMFLVGTSASGAVLNTTLPFHQAYFLTGVFATNTTNANAAAPQAQTIAKAAKFVLPGTFIAIDPVGLYLYSVYLGMFLVIVGYGTFERYKFRMSYRKRTGAIGGGGGKKGKGGAI